MPRWRVHVDARADGLRYAVALNSEAVSKSISYGVGVERAARTGEDTREEG